MSRGMIIIIFGASKSLHIIGDYNDYFGIYWHNEKHGSAHYSNYDEKLGMKFYLWSFSREGAIWEELLTDDSGQYAELQSGRMYNQPKCDQRFYNHLIIMSLLHRCLITAL